MDIIIALGLGFIIILLHQIVRGIVIISGTLLSIAETLNPDKAKDLEKALEDF